MKPHFVVGEPENPYMLRWYLIPKNPVFNIYLHKFLRSDEDRALHDHPWANISIVLAGRYNEVVPEDDAAWRSGHSRLTVKKLRKPFRPVFRRARSIHRVELLKEEDMPSRYEGDCPAVWIPSVPGAEVPCWSLFITGPKVRQWGFWCPAGWKHWAKFVSVRRDGNSVGPGCE